MPKFGVELDVNATFVFVANPTVTIVADSYEEAKARVEQMATELERQFAANPYAAGTDCELADMLRDTLEGGGFNVDDPADYEFDHPEDIEVLVVEVSEADD